MNAKEVISQNTVHNIRAIEKKAWYADSILLE